MKYLNWIVLMCSSICTQDLVINQNSIGLQIGEPWSIQYQRSFHKHPDFRIGAGLGMLGYYLILILLLTQSTVIFANSITFENHSGKLLTADSIFNRSQPIQSRSLLGFTSASITLIKPINERTRQNWNHWGFGIGGGMNHRRGKVLDVFSGILLSVRNGGAEKYKHRFVQYVGYWTNTSKEYRNIQFQLYSAEVPLVFRFNISGDYKLSFDFSPSLNFNFIRAKGQTVERNFAGAEIIGHSQNFPIIYRKIQTGVNIGFNRCLIIGNQQYDVTIGAHFQLSELFKENHTPRADEYIDIDRNTLNSNMNIRFSKWF